MKKKVKYLALPISIFLCSIFIIYSTASAFQIDVSSTFFDQATDNPRDIFTIENNSDLGIQISEISIDLDPAGLFIDTRDSIIGFPFTVDLGGIETGFLSVTGDITGSTLLTLAFSDFDRGETFSFFIDIDDGSGGGIITGDEFADTRLVATFSGSTMNDPTLSAPYVADGEFRALAQININSTVPEPTTVVLCGIGLVGFAGVVARRKWKKKAVEKS